MASPAQCSGSPDRGWTALGPDGGPEKGQEKIPESLGRTTALPTKGLAMVEWGVGRISHKLLKLLTQGELERREEITAGDTHNPGIVFGMPNYHSTGK